MYVTRDNKKIVHNRDIFFTAPQITKDAPSGGAAVLIEDLRFEGAIYDS